MSETGLMIFAFVTGLTVTGLASALIELRMRCRVSFSEPVFALHRPMQSMALSVVAGPVMLFNDAMEARSVRRIGTGMMLSCFVTCGFWAFAIGIVSLEMLWRLVHA